MAGCCHHDHCEAARADGTYRRVLWAALAINAVTFGVEGAAGILSGSVALKADALDFLGDAANYGISLYAVGQAVHWRSGAALAKAAGMGLIGLWVLGEALYRVFVTGVPSAFTMGVISFFALLFRFVNAMPTCARSGCAAGTTSPASWPCCSRRAACSRPALLGQTLLWRC
jgi:Co/Zn/Cd efflux system component